MYAGKAKIIVNPVASGGKVGQRWPQLAQVLTQGGLQFGNVLIRWEKG